MTEKLPTFTDVKQATSKHLGIPVSVIENIQNRIHEVVYARHLAFYVTRQVSFISLDKLAKEMAGEHAKRHSTVVYAGKRIAKELRAGGERAEKIRADIKAVTDLLKQD